MNAGNVEDPGHPKVKSVSGATSFYFLFSSLLGKPAWRPDGLAEKATETGEVAMRVAAPTEAVIHACFQINGEGEQVVAVAAVTEGARPNPRLVGHQTIRLESPVEKVENRIQTRITTTYHSY